MGFVDTYSRFRYVAGINITVKAGDEYKIDLCCLKVDGNRLAIEKKVNNLPDLNQLQKHLPGKTIVALNICGKPILVKKIAKHETIDQAAFHNVMLNANIDDFYIQNFVSEESSFMAVIRRVDADQWLRRLTALGLVPIILSLGPFPIENIIKQTNFYDTEINFDGHGITRNDDGEWIGYRQEAGIKAGYPVKLNDEKADESSILPYAVAFQSIMIRQLPPIFAPVRSLEVLLSEKLSMNRLKVVGVLALSLLFFLLIINTVLFTSLRSSNDALTDKIAHYSQNAALSKQINNLVNDKVVLIQNLGWEGAGLKSARIDQVAAMLPGEVTLTQVAVDPINAAASKTEKKWVFYARRIVLSGQSKNIGSVNEWIARIKTIKWVKNIQIVSYHYDNELNTGVFMTTIDF